MLIDYNQIQQWIEEACHANDVAYLIEDIEFTFDNRMTNCFGLAYVKRKFIKFSIPLWERATQEERKQVVMHEACHVIACDKYGVEANHGKEWKQCMKAVGRIAEKYHSISREGLKKTYIKYECACDCHKTFIGHIKAAQVRQGNLVCQRCNGEIKLTGKEMRP